MSDFPELPDDLEAVPASGSAKLNAAGTDEAEAVSLVGTDFGGFHSGFVSLVGRPNAGKSTLMNQICGEKIAITSNKPQTTRHQIRGVYHGDETQIVFVDTPGIHKPVSALGERLNSTASAAISDVDVVCLLIDATKPYGKGDQFVAQKLPKNAIVVVNKVDIAKRDEIIAQLVATSGLEFAEYFPVSARTGKGVKELLDYLISRMPEGPRYFPDDMVSDVPDMMFIAELVREQLFRATRQELPYSIATQVTEMSWPHIRCEIIVERDSQKGMVIGKGGSLLKDVGIAVRKQLPEGAFIELHVTVDKDWQRRPNRIELLGY